MLKYLALVIALGLAACNNTHPPLAKSAVTSKDCMSMNIADCAVVHSPVNQ